MMTIDEAIQHSREKAKEKRKDYERACALNIPSDGCLECAEEHEQLAEWLEELKRYKAQKFVIKVDYKKAPALKELLQHSQFGMAYPDGQYEVVPLDSDRWIPVGERLPEEKKNPNTNDFAEVLCSTVWGDVRTYKFGKPIGFDESHFWYACGIMDKYVTHWRYLPEPYKENGGKT